MSVQYLFSGLVSSCIHALEDQSPSSDAGKISCKFVRLMNHILLVLLSKDCFLVDPFPVCNLAKGKWVPDNRQPLYSGFECKQWLSEMWACRLTQRTDFAYERLRWQPKDCQMEEFEGSKFLRRYSVF